MKRFIIALVIVGALIQGVCAGSYADFVKQVKPYTEEYHAISRGVTNVIRSGNVPDLQDMQRRIDGLIRMYNAAPLQHQEWMKALNIDITSLVGFLVSIQDLIARKEGLAEQQLVIAREGQHVAERQLAALQTNYDRALVRIADGRENVGQAVLEKYHGANPAEKARLERDVAEANQLVVAGAELVLAQDGEKKEEDVFKAAGQIGQAQQMNEALMEGKTQDIHKLQREVAEVVQERDQAKEEVVGIGEQLDEAEVEVRKLKRQLAQTEEKARNAKSEEERVRLAEQAEREKEAVKKAQETAQDYSEKIQHRQARINELEGERQRIEANIQNLRSDIDQLKEQNEKLQRLIEELSLEANKIGTIRSTVANLYKQEQALAGIDATYVRLKALQGIDNLSAEVKAQAVRLINNSRLEEDQKMRLLNELENPLSDEQRKELADLTKARRAITLHSIRNAHAIIQGLLREKESAIQEHVASTQNTWQRWWSGGYDKEQITDQDLKADIALLEREVELGKALKKVGYSATEAMKKFPKLFSNDAVMGMRPEAAGLALGGQHRLQIAGAPQEHVQPQEDERPVAPGRMAQLALWGSRAKRFGSAAGRFAKSVFTPAAAETDILKIVENAKQEIRNKEEQERDDRDSEDNSRVARSSETVAYQVVEPTFQEKIVVEEPESSPTFDQEEFFDRYSGSFS